jgi:hypothetical protein
MERHIDNPLAMPLAFVDAHSGVFPQPRYLQEVPGRAICLAVTWPSKD